jgi:flagellar biosynthesis protein FliQ
MERAAALIIGIVAWAAVAGVAVSVVQAWSGDNQVLAFLPILGAVIVAWAIGEVVTKRLFDGDEEESGGGG